MSRDTYEPSKDVLARWGAAKGAREVLGDTADVLDIVTLAEFLLGEGTAPADAVATPSPFLHAGFAPRPPGARRFPSVTALLTETRRAIGELTTSEVLSLYDEIAARLQKGRN